MIRDIILKIAKKIVSDYKYIHDPEHKNRPKDGQKWYETEKGWSNYKTVDDFNNEEVLKLRKSIEKREKEFPGLRGLVNKDEIKDVIKNKSYSVISAWSNPEKEKMDKDSDPNKFIDKMKERTDQLLKKLSDMSKKHGITFSPVVGNYGGIEPSFIVFHNYESMNNYSVKDGDREEFIVHNYEDNKNVVSELNKLGKEFNQDSVLHSVKGQPELHYTTGDNVGKVCKGKDTSFEKINDGYSKIKNDKGYTKWSAGLDQCFSDNPPLTDSNPYF